MTSRLQQSANRAAALRKRQMDRLAQLVSEGVGVNQAGERMKLTKGQTARLWATIKREMGGQAR